MRPRVSRRRLLGYAAVLAVGVSVAYATRLHPQQDLDALLETVRTDEGSRIFYTRQRAALGFFPGHGYSLTLYVSYASSFAPATYLILTRFRGELAGQIMFASGVEGTSTLTGSDLATYMQDADLSLAGLEEVYGEYFAKSTASTPRAR